MTCDTGEPAAPPRATYRLQFHKHFTFRDALELVPYLAELGISHIYASPIMEARPGSTHGYDIVNHNRLNPEIGSDEDFRALVAALRGPGMGLIVDIVPNHMGIGGQDNAWWLDVLEWGEASSCAAYFDIDWDAARADLKGRVLLPVLGDQYGAILEAGEIELRFDASEGSFSFHYYEHRFPASPLAYRTILAAAGTVLSAAADEFSGLQRAKRGGARPAAVALKRRLAELAKQPKIAAVIEAAVRSWTGAPGRAASYRPLHRLLDQQAYRLAYWRVAADEINYRRFFNVNDLAALRIEQPDLFAETHRLTFAMAERGDIDGLRIDHIDGLFDPAAYVTAVRGRCPGLYLVVEKILARYETLPDWPVDGSTGYDFANQVLGLFVDPDAERAMTRLYTRLTGRAGDFDTTLLSCKQRIMRVNLSSEMNVLARRFHRLSMSERRTRDFTFNGMLAALEQVIAAFPVYRTYVSERSAGDEDRRYIDWAIAVAKKQSRARDTSIFDFLHQVLTGAVAGHSRPADVRRAAMQFQQVTGPVMAKACEDTAFYRYFRLLALNEVGGDPRRFGLSAAGFHHSMRERAHRWPLAMSATATHDTKRGEDARVRLAMLSEMPRRWGQYVSRWLRFNRSRRFEVEGEIVPDRNVEYLFYQTLVGAWLPGLAPDDVEGMKTLAERMTAYMSKAVREGKEESSWSNPNADYEAALEKFTSAVLDVSRPNAFLADFYGFIMPLARLSAIASLAQLVLKLTAPGVPDIYQGCELWDFNLVDPDNRRPPDWGQRQSLLAEIGAAGPAALAGDWKDGREKLFAVHRLLSLRQRQPALFARGDYAALPGEGGAADHLCAFVRQHEGAAVVVAVPRLVYRLHAGGEAAEWGSASLPLPHERRWQDVFTGRVFTAAQVPAAELFGRFPVAVLFSEPG